VEHLSTLSSTFPPFFAPHLPSSSLYLFILVSVRRQPLDLRAVLRAILSHPATQLIQHFEEHFHDFFQHCFPFDDCRTLAASSGYKKIQTGGRLQRGAMGDLKKPGAVTLRKLAVPFRNVQGNAVTVQGDPGLRFSL
jgi:hypothetical protein